MKRHHEIEDVLKYSPIPANRATVRRKYAEWRNQKGIPPRCDIEACQFHIQPLVWIGRELPLILDHKNGNKLDNSPKNLWYLCPNCDSQLPTRGGANRGRLLEAEEGKYVLLERNGTRHYHLIPEPAHLKITTYPPTVIIKRADTRKRRPFN